jgi:bacterial leucyl aminopeptidase
MKTAQVTLLLIIALLQISVTTLVAQDSLNDSEIFSLMDALDGNLLRAHVENLQGFGTRHVNSAINEPDFGIGAARNYIYGQFEQIAADSNGQFQVQFQDFDMSYNGVYTHQKNVLGILAGSNPETGYLIIGAHYDSINTDFNDARGFAPGANDNGTGVAALIEMSRVLSQSQHYYGIIFVAFSAEELNRVGSKSFVRWAQESQIRIVGMINIDGIGNSYNASTGERDESLRVFSCETEVFCTDGGRSRQMARSAQFIGLVESVPLELRLEEQADRHGRYGDHFSFAELGYPSIRFINTLEEWGNGSTLDIVDFIEWDYFLKASQSILLVAVSLADAPAPSHIALEADERGQTTLVWDEVAGAERYVIALRASNSPVYDGGLLWTSTVGMSLQSDNLRSGQWAAVAVASRGSRGFVGWLSEEYALSVDSRQ